MLETAITAFMGMALVMYTLVEGYSLSPEKVLPWVVEQANKHPSNDLFHRIM